MKRTLNFVLNQLGLVVVVFAGLLVYYGYFDLNWYFGVTVGAILFFILISSELFYKNFKRDIKRSRKRIRSRTRVRAV